MSGRPTRRRIRRSRLVQLFSLPANRQHPGQPRHHPPNGNQTPLRRHFFPAQPPGHTGHHLQPRQPRRHPSQRPLQPQNRHHRPKLVPLHRRTLFLRPPRKLHRPLARPQPNLHQLPALIFIFFILKHPAFC